MHTLLEPHFTGLLLLLWSKMTFVYFLFLPCLVFFASIKLGMAHEGGPAPTQVKDNPVREPTGGRRVLRGVKMRSTSQCNGLKDASEYDSELQLLYIYLIEFVGTGPPDLTALEDAVSVAIASVLKDCDLFDRPMYVVKTNTKHELSKTGTINRPPSCNWSFLIRVTFSQNFVHRHLTKTHALWSTVPPQYFWISTHRISKRLPIGQSLMA